MWAVFLWLSDTPLALRSSQTDAEQKCDIHTMCICESLVLMVGISISTIGADRPVHSQSGQREWEEIMLILHIRPLAPSCFPPGYRCLVPSPVTSILSALPPQDNGSSSDESPPLPSPMLTASSSYFRRSKAGQGGRTCSQPRGRGQGHSATLLRLPSRERAEPDRCQRAREGLRADHRRRLAPPQVKRVGREGHAGTHHTTTATRTARHRPACREAAFRWRASAAGLSRSFPADGLRIGLGVSGRRRIGGRGSSRRIWARPPASLPGGRK